MSDYDTDGDGDDVFYEDGDEQDDLDNQNLQINQNVHVNIPNNPADPAYQLNEKKKEFDGSNNFKNNWIQCYYCTKYHPNSMHLPDVSYCGHCWGWLNSEQLKLTEGKYTGPNTIDEVKNFLKLTYPLHPTTCVNTECVYNKIKQLADTKTLHWDFCVVLGLVREEKNKSENKTTEYKINKKRSNTRINYKSSSITI